MRPYRVLCLDFDGVILDSVSVKDDAYGALFHGLDGETRAKVVEAHRATPGVPRPLKVRRLYEMAFGRPPSEALADTLVARYAALVEDAMNACPEVPGTLAVVRGQTVPVYVVTAAPEDEVRAIIGRRGWTTLFADVMGAPRAKADLLALVCRRENAAPADLVFVGDRPNDLAAAQEAGTAFVGRVPAGAASPFPAGVPIVADLTGWGAP